MGDKSDLGLATITATQALGKRAQLALGPVDGVNDGLVAFGKNEGDTEDDAQLSEGVAAYGQAWHVGPALLDHFKDEAAGGGGAVDDHVDLLVVG